MFGLGLGRLGAAMRAIWNPRSLFGNNEVGVWYDPSDFSTMFQDSAGTTPVTAVEQPVGLMLDKSGNDISATQSTAAARPLYKVYAPSAKGIYYDKVDDTLSMTLPTGTYTFCQAAPSGNGTSYTLFTEGYVHAGGAMTVPAAGITGFIAVNRALTATEKQNVANYYRSKNYLIGTNDIGVAGFAGFGTGTCPALPVGYTAVAGYDDIYDDDYGNYTYSDGSVMVWIPAFYMRFGDVRNTSYARYGVNSIDIVSATLYATEAAAEADGYYLHRAFKNAGANQPGFFRDAYDCSQNGTIASSIANVMPMVSGPISEASTAIVAARVYTILSVGTTDFTLIGAASNTVGLRFTATGVGVGTGTVSQQIGFVGCTANGQTPANFYYGALQAAKSRGNKFFPESVFIADALCRISEAHAQAATSATYCAWYDATGVRNFPKGNDNNALKSEADVTLNGAGAVTFTSAGATTQPNFAKTGSGSVFARTTHNGQACGIADVAGNIYKINPGLTCIATSKAITAATQANPVALTVAAHGRTTGDYVQIDSVVGMTQLNGKIYVVTVVDANTLTLNGVDGTAFGAWTSGGTVINGTFYALKESVDIAAVTSGTTLATGHWGATGVAAQFDAVTLNFATTYPNNTYMQRFGNAANAVFDMSTANGRALAMLGLPTAGGMSTAGSSAMGTDYYYQYMRDLLGVISRGYWGNSSGAGSRFRFLDVSRTNANNFVGFACASYL